MTNNTYTHPEWCYDAVLYEMNIRQATPEGTILAATKRLKSLRDIGIDAIWLMPIYPIGEENRKGSLGSYYSIADYCAINPEFGTMEDFDNLIKEAHSLGMKVLLDWVANHTARDARWLKTKPADWYERETDGEAKVPWDWTDTAKLNYVRVSELYELFGCFLASSSASAIYEYQLRLVRKLRNLGSAYFLVWNVYRSGDMTFGIFVGSAHVENYIVFLVFHHLNRFVHAYLTVTQR